MIRVGDMVEVRSGDDKGVRSRVSASDPTKRLIVVEGCNKTYKHVKRSQRNPKGGRLSVEAAFPVSKVGLVCARCDRVVRIRVAERDGGSDVRICRRCGSEIT